MKVLVFCSDVLPLPGLPTSGGGLRCWQLIRSLQWAGHEVITSMPLFTFHGKRVLADVPAEYVKQAWNPGNQDELTSRHRPDAVLFTSTWIVDHLQQPFDGLRIYDLDGPQLLEMHYKRDLQRGESTQRKVEKLAQADFVFCAGQRQRFYFWPFLLLAGHELDRPDLLPVIPIARMEPMPELPQEGSENDGIRILVAGGFYPWQDPRVGLRVLGETLAEFSPEQVSAQIIGTSHGVIGDDDRQFEELREELRRLPNVRFLDFVPHERLSEISQQSSLAFELHARNPEREIAITTRTVDALWSGLPVLYNHYAELSELIRQYDAGWTVDPSDPSAIKRILRDILSTPQAIVAKRVNAQKLVRDHFFGPQVAAPLLDFLGRPEKRVAAERASVVSQQKLELMEQGQREWEMVQQSRAYRIARRLASMKRGWRNRVND